MAGKKIFIKSYACELRDLDSTKISKYLSKNHHEIVNNPKDADIIFILTCGFTNNTTNYSLKKIKKFQKYDAELIVSGCVPAIDEKRLSEIFLGKTLPTKDLDKIDDFFPDNKIKFNTLIDGHISYKNPSRLKFYTNFINFVNRVRTLKKIYRFIQINFGKIDEKYIYNFSTTSPFYYLKICQGCNGNCSYCAISKAIGKLKSKPVKKCVEEFKSGLENGYENFIIAADNVGSYGVDINKDLTVLLKNLMSVNGQYEFIIREIGPYWVVKYIDELVSICKERKIRDMGIVIQSANNRILKLMNRYSDVNKTRESIKRLRSAYPELKLHTHVIVGFPTETKDEFKQTLSFVKDINFDSGVIFPFSLKINTMAENIQPKVSKNEILRRMKYSKKYLKKNGYKIINLPNLDYFFFTKKKNYLIKNKDIR